VECRAGAQKISPKSGRGLSHVTPTIFGSTVGYPSDSLASCSLLGQVIAWSNFVILSVLSRYIIQFLMETLAMSTELHAVNCAVCQCAQACLWTACNTCLSENINLMAVYICNTSAVMETKDW